MARRIGLHAEAEAHAVEDFLDFVERFASEVLRAQQLGFGFLHQLVDRLDAGVLQAVVRADGKLELFDRAVELFADAIAAALGHFFHLIGQFFEVDEDRHVILQQLRGVADGVLRGNGAVGPDFKGELVVIGHLTETGGFHGEVHFANRGVDRVDRNIADGEVFVEILISADVAAAGLEAHFDIELTAFAHGCDVEVAVEDFDVGVGFDGAGEDFAGGVGPEADGLDGVTDDFEGNLLEVEDDVGGVFDNAGDGTEFVIDTLDANGGDGRAFDARKQDTAQRIADRGAEASLERLGGELPEALRQRLGIGYQTLWFLKALKRHL